MHCTPCRVQAEQYGRASSHCNFPVSLTCYHGAATCVITRDVVSNQQHDETPHLLTVVPRMFTTGADGSDQTQPRTLTFRFLHF